MGIAQRGSTLAKSWHQVVGSAECGGPHTIPYSPEDRAGMIRRDGSRRALRGLLTLLVAFEGFLGVIPHDHPVNLAPGLVCDNPHCPDPTGAHLGTVGTEHGDHVCLACSTFSVELFAARSVAWFGLAEPLPLVVVGHDASPSIPDRWSLPLRGPPALA